MSFDVQRLVAILDETTMQYRKGPQVVEDKSVPGIDVTHIFNFPHVDDCPPELEQHDLHFIIIGVDSKAADARRGDLEEVLSDYPEPERLEGGPSYIETGAVIGSQDYALRLYALGEQLGMWEVITPKTLKIEGPMADQLAGNGMVMMSGWKPPE